MTTAPTPVHRHISPLIPALVVVAAVALGYGIAQLVHHDGWHTGSGTVGSGVAAVQLRHVPPFAGVNLAGSNNVDVHVGGKQAVRVRTDDNLLPFVTTRVEAGMLVIADTGSYSTRTPTAVEITVPSLDRLVLSGSGNIAATGVHAAHLAVTLSGSGTLHATGSADRLDVALSGSGDLQLEGLVARDVVADLTASGRIGVHPTKTLDASVEGSGVIIYTGSPAHVTKNVTGSGAIIGG